MATFTPEQLAGNKIIQIAYTVTDMRKAAQFWVTNLGAGPFFVFDEAPVSGAVDINNNPVDIALGAAIGQWGAIQVELMQWHTVGTESISNILTKPGFNHVAYFSNDPASEADNLKAQGIPPLVSLKFGQVPVYWHDGRDVVNGMVEHFPAHEDIVNLFTMVAEAADGWDGSDPVRTLS